MAAILRLAGGLDRSRTQAVRDVAASIADGRAVIEAVADEEPQVDLWGAERRTDLFEKVFGMPVEFRWAKPATTGATRARRPGSKTGNAAATRSR